MTNTTTSEYTDKTTTILANSWCVSPFIVFTTELWLAVPPSCTSCQSHVTVVVTGIDHRRFLSSISGSFRFRHSWSIQSLH